MFPVIRAVLALWILVLVGCGDTSPDQWIGMYSEKFEYNGFTECGSTEPWVLRDDSVKNLCRMNADPNAQRIRCSVFVELSGTLKCQEEGFGHLDSYHCTITDHRILELNATRQCPM